MKRKDADTNNPLILNFLLILIVILLAVIAFKPNTRQQVSNSYNLDNLPSETPSNYSGGFDNIGNPDKWRSYEGKDLNQFAFRYPSVCKTPIVSQDWMYLDCPFGIIRFSDVIGPGTEIPINCDNFTLKNGEDLDVCLYRQDVNAVFIGIYKPSGKRPIEFTFRIIKSKNKVSEAWEFTRNFLSNFEP